MAIFETLLGGAATVASGGLFGLAGSLIGAGVKYLDKKQQLAEAREERKHELELLALSMEQQDKETENELKIIEANAQSEIRTGSYQMPVSVNNVHMWVNDVRALFRPILTILLNIGCGVVCVYLFHSLGDSTNKLSQILLQESPASQLVTYMINSLMFVATSATMWWFGDRALTPPNLKQR